MARRGIARTGARALAVLAAGAFGALLSIGFVLALLFELQGFGAPRDEGPRLGHLLLHALGLGTAAGGPIVLWRALFPASSPGWIVAAVPLVGAVLFVLGIGAAR